MTDDTEGTPQPETRQMCVMDPATRDELVSLLRRDLPMEKAEGAVTVLRSLQLANIAMVPRPDTDGA